MRSDPLDETPEDRLRAAQRAVGDALRRILDEEWEAAVSLLATIAEHEAELLEGVLGETVWPDPDSL